MRTHLPSPKTTFTQLPENNIYVKLWTNWSNSTCTSMFGRSDKCRRPASSLADISTLVIQSIFILKYHIHACTFSIPVCSPIKCYLKCQSNGHLYNFTTFINENKIHFSDTVNWIKSHNDKNQDDLDDNLNHTLGFHCTSQIMTQ